MRTLRLLIKRGVTLPGGINALPGASCEVEERFARGLIYDGRAVPDPGILAPDPAEPQDGPEETGPDEPPRAPTTSQDRDPRPINRDPSRRRTGPRSGPRR